MANKITQLFRSGICCMTILAFAQTPVLAQSSPPNVIRWLEDARGCKVFDPEPVYPYEVVSWNGHCKNGYADGEGILVLPSRKWRFDGTFHDGFFVYGRGERTNGTYTGEFQRSLAHGKGELVMNDGRRVKGDFVAGIPQGWVEDYYIEGSRYMGQVMRNEADGHGRLELHDGTTYEGEWRFGKRHGQGKEIMPNGDVYEGGFRANERTGFAILEFANGARYEGEFRAGVSSRTWRSDNGCG